MAKRSFSSPGDLKKAVMEQARAALASSTVAREAKNLLMENVYYDVLSVYSPMEYKRRKRGGLEDPRTYVTYVAGDSEAGYELQVTSVAEPDTTVRERYGWAERYRTPYDPEGSRLLQWIEYGSVPNYFNDFNGYAWTRPRQALHSTQEDINKGALWEAVEAELRKRLG